MIALTIPAKAEGQSRFVARLNHLQRERSDPADALLVSISGNRQVFSGEQGLFELVAVDEADFDGDVVVVDPKRGMAERLIRSSSAHNTFLVTERCDQLCVMCSQPPKKTHVDRFAEYLRAALLAPLNTVIGLSGGEPTLFKDDLFSLIETASQARADLSFHILTNGQHFDVGDVSRLAGPLFDKVTWGIPLYSHDALRHDAIVKKSGAYQRLMESFAHLLAAGSKVELRTVLLQDNLDDLPALARLVTTHLGFVVQWSIMQLENIGFAKNRFADLYVDLLADQSCLYEAIDVAQLFGLRLCLFNIPRCAVRSAYRPYAIASISDWKRKYPKACKDCRERSDCSGFFEWHPEHLLEVNPL